MLNLESAKFPILLSYAFVRDGQWKEDTLQWFMENPLIDILIDSGAFSFHQTGVKPPLGEYMRWIQRWRKYIWGFIAMDVPGDPKRSRRNLEVMWEQGFNPIPVHVMGDPPEWFDTLYEHSPLVCVASLPIRERLADRNKSFLKTKMAMANGRPTHWLGYCDEGMLQTFKPYSVDSSSWTASCRFGVATIYMGNGRRMVFRRPYIAEHGVPQEYEKEIEKVCTRAGISLAEFLNVKEWRGWRKENPCLTVSVWSWAQYVMELKEQFGVRYFLSITRYLDCNSWFPVLNRIYESDYLDKCPGRKTQAW